MKVQENEGLSCEDTDIEEDEELGKVRLSLHFLFSSFNDSAHSIFRVPARVLLLSPLLATLVFCLMCKGKATHLQRLHLHTRFHQRTLQNPISILSRAVQA